MIYILYDPDQKFPIQGAFRIPQGVTLDDAETKIKAAYAEDSVEYVDRIEAVGFESVEWTPVDVSE